MDRTGERMMACQNLTTVTFNPAKGNLPATSQSTDFHFGLLRKWTVVIEISHQVEVYLTE